MVDGDAGSKKQKKEAEEEKKKLELQMKEQSQLVWGIKDKLRQFCSTNDMKELLIANGQEVPSGESNVRNRPTVCVRSEERRVGEECRSRGWPDH